jgi:hypothetical protein
MRLLLGALDEPPTESAALEMVRIVALEGFDLRVDYDLL